MDPFCLPQPLSPLGRWHAAFRVDPTRAEALREVLAPMTMRTMPAPAGWSNRDDPPLILVRDRLTALLVGWNEVTAQDPWVDLWRAVLAIRESTEDLGLGLVPEPMAWELVACSGWSMEGHRKRLLNWTPALHAPGTARSLLDTLARLEGDAALDEAWASLLEDVVACELDERRAEDAERDRALGTEGLQARLDQEWEATWVRMQRWATRIRAEPEAAWLQLVA